MVNTVVPKLGRFYPEVVQKKEMRFLEFVITRTGFVDFCLVLLVDIEGFAFPDIPAETMVQRIKSLQYRGLPGSQRASKEKAGFYFGAHHPFGRRLDILNQLGPSYVYECIPAVFNLAAIQFCQEDLQTFFSYSLNLVG